MALQGGSGLKTQARRLPLSRGSSDDSIDSVKEPEEAKAVSDIGPEALQHVEKQPLQQPQEVQEPQEPQEPQLPLQSFRRSSNVSVENDDSPENQGRRTRDSDEVGSIPDNQDSDEDGADDDEERDLVSGLGGVVGGQRSIRMGGSSGHGDTLLDFIDEVSDGISSYLGFLEERQKGVVYDRHDRAESQRWKECLRQIHTTSSKRAQAEPPPLAVNPQPFGAGSLPCPPPRDLFFEEPQILADGKPRLSFSACFESGNLALAKSDTPTQYTLLLDFDVNTSGYTQWFYFGVRGGFQGMKVTFRIVNMAKGDSLFSKTHGMRPAVWSELLHQKFGRGWERGCFDVSYFANEHRHTGKRDGEHAATYHTLEFSYMFEGDDDTVFFAYHFPYTYSHLQDLLAWLVEHPYSSKLVKRDTLCRTIGGLACEVLEIGEPRFPDGTPKPLAIATARVHPGESNSSWMMQGLLLFLCSPTPEAQALRDACLWIVVPMLNPDGVIQGNYRCGLAGTDLNRCFAKPHHRLHPTVWHLKERIRNRPAEVYLDLHGHSKKEGVFLYGGVYSSDEKRNAEVRLLPRLCSLASSDFKYWQCVFSVQESKMSTGRLVAFMQLGISQAYTVEASFANAGQPEDGEEDPAPEEVARRILTPESVAAVPQKQITPASEDATPKTQMKQQMRSKVPKNQSRLRRSNSVVSRQSGISNLSRNSDDESGFESNSSPEPESEDSADADFMHAHRQRVTLANAPGLAPQVQVPEVPQVPQVSQAPQVPVKADFSPVRLELVGPAILRALFCNWQLTKGLRRPKHQDGSVSGSPIFDGVEHMGWRHLHYDRLTMAMARDMFTRLLTKREDVNPAKIAAARLAVDADDGSDSAPSADEKKGDELHAIHRRLLQKLRRRRRHEKPPEPEVKEEEQQYKTVVAFGKTLKIPIVNGRLKANKPQEDDKDKEKRIVSTTGRRTVFSVPPVDSGGRPSSAPLGGHRVSPSPESPDSPDSPPSANAERYLRKGKSLKSSMAAMQGGSARPPSPISPRTGTNDEESGAGETLTPTVSEARRQTGKQERVILAQRRASLWRGDSLLVDGAEAGDADDDEEAPDGLRGDSRPARPQSASRLARPSSALSREGNDRRHDQRSPSPTLESLPPAPASARPSSRSRVQPQRKLSVQGVEGRYAASDVRNFVEVRSIKPSREKQEKVSTSQRAAQQLKQFRSSPGSGASSVFGLPPAVGPASEKKWTVSALHRIPIHKVSPEGSGSASAPPSARTDGSSPTVVSTQRHRQVENAKSLPPTPSSPRSGMRTSDQSGFVRRPPSGKRIRDPPELAGQVNAHPQDATEHAIQAAVATLRPSSRAGINATRDQENGENRSREATLGQKISQRTRAEVKATGEPESGENRSWESTTAKHLRESVVGEKLSQTLAGHLEGEENRSREATSVRGNTRAGPCRHMPTRCFSAASEVDEIGAQDLHEFEAMVHSSTLSSHGSYGRENGVAESWPRTFNHSRPCSPLTGEASSSLAAAIAEQALVETTSSHLKSSQPVERPIRRHSLRDALGHVREMQFSTGAPSTSASPSDPCSPVSLVHPGAAWSLVNEQGGTEAVAATTPAEATVPLSSLIAASSLRPRAPMWMEPRTPTSAKVPGPSVTKAGDAANEAGNSHTLPLKAQLRARLDAQKRMGNQTSGQTPVGDSDAAEIVSRSIRPSSRSARVGPGPHQNRSGTQVASSRSGQTQGPRSSGKSGSKPRHQVRH